MYVHRGSATPAAAVVHNVRPMPVMVTETPRQITVVGGDAAVTAVPQRQRWAAVRLTTASQPAIWPFGIIPGGAPCLCMVVCVRARCGSAAVCVMWTRTRDVCV